jgi:hypothetical protein
MKKLMLFAALFFVANIAYSDSYHGIVYESAPTESTVINTETANGAALAIAMSQLGFEWGTKSFQAGVGLGSFDGEDAISIGIGKRVDRLLINGSIGREGNKYGYGLGLRFHF